MQGHQKLLASTQNPFLILWREFFEIKLLVKEQKLRITSTFARKMASRCSLRVVFSNLW